MNTKQWRRRSLRGPVVSASRSVHASNAARSYAKHIADQPALSEFQSTVQTIYCLNFSASMDGIVAAAVVAALCVSISERESLCVFELQATKCRPTCTSVSLKSSEGVVSKVLAACLAVRQGHSLHLHES